MDEGLPPTISGLINVRPPSGRQLKPAKTMIVVVMGVSATGKTTVGERVAARLGWHFEDADKFHTTENKEKMAHGEPLNDVDRWRWLDALRNRIRVAADRGEGLVLACSALKEIYRERLTVPGAPGAMRFVYLKISLETARQRLAKRRGHFMPGSLIESQFADLEEPREAQWLNAEANLDDLVKAIIEFK